MPITKAAAPANQQPPVRRSSRRLAKNSSSVDSALPQPLPVQPQPAFIDKALFLCKFTENALRQVKEGNHEEYGKLVKVFVHSQSEAHQASEQYVEEVTPWISAVSANVSALDISYRELVHAILFSDWIATADDRFVHRYATLVLQILSAHPAWVPQAMSALVRWFIYGARAHEVPAALAVHDRLHALLEQIYRAIPTCGASLSMAITDAHPFRTARANVQVLFLQNVLRMLDYAIGLRREVLHTVLNRIIQVDVEVQIEIEDLNSDDDDEDEIANDGNPDASAAMYEDGVFDFDEDEDEQGPADDLNSDSDSDFGSDSSELGEIKYNAKQVVAKLDAIMSTLFTWLERHSQPDPELGEMPEAAMQLFLLFLDLFTTVVLPTFKSRYTQFFVFYLCGRDPQFADVFLGTMMGIVGEPVRSTASGQASTVTKVAAASYLSSLVSRARYLPGNIVRNVVGVLVQWASTYLEVQDQLQCEAEEELRRRQPHPWAKTYAQVTATGLQSSATDFERHAVFYAVTQAIMYLFCFRWRDLAEAAGGGAVIESELDNLRWCQEVEGVQRVIFSKLNPLRACSPAVAQQFSQVASQTNYMFCYAVLQQNRRTGDAADEGSAANSKSPPTHIQILRTELVTFFPFDPMLLPISRQFIDDIYLVWQNVGAEPSDSNDDNDDGDESSEDGRDDADVVDQMVAMSISPARPLSVLTGQPF